MWTVPHDRDATGRYPHSPGLCRRPLLLASRPLEERGGMSYHGHTCQLPFAERPMGRCPACEYDRQMEAASRPLPNIGRLLDALADVVIKSTEYGQQDGGFVRSYIIPTGPIHRAIALLGDCGVIVRP